MLHPCTDGVNLCFSAVDEDSCSHLVVEKSHNCDEVARASKSGQNVPESFKVDGVGRLSQVNESHAKILGCFVPDISLEFDGP